MIKTIILIVLAIALYVFIGSIVEMIADRHGCPTREAFIAGIILWPLLLLIGIIYAISYFPFKLARWILVQLSVINKDDF